VLLAEKFFASKKYITFTSGQRKSSSSGLTFPPFQPIGLQWNACSGILIWRRSTGSIFVRIPQFFLPLNTFQIRFTFLYVKWVPGALSLGVKRPGREADHSPPSSAEVKE
jgi:hypothetical protein